jgi:hypothetical protein
MGSSQATLRAASLELVEDAAFCALRNMLRGEGAFGFLVIDAGRATIETLQAYDGLLSYPATNVALDPIMMDSNNDELLDMRYSKVVQKPHPYACCSLVVALVRKTHQCFGIADRFSHAP